MKREISLNIIVLALLAVICLQARPVAAELRVFACEPEWGSLAGELGGELLDISVATTGRQDPHHIQARPSLLAKARRADLLVCTGAELEVGWLPLLLRKSGNPGIQAGAPGFFMATDYVPLREVPTHLDRSQGDIHASGNPHIQTDPNNILMVAEALAKRLEALDQDNVEAYRKRFGKFESRWRKKMAEWNDIASNLSGMPVIVHHKSWSYLVNWLKLQEVATLEPKPGVPPTSGYLAEVLKTVREKPAKAIIHAEYEDHRSASWLARRSSIPIVSLPYTVGGTDEVTNLFTLFDVTLEKLREAGK